MSEWGVSKLIYFNELRRILLFHFWNSTHDAWTTKCLRKIVMRQSFESVRRHEKAFFQLRDSHFVQVGIESPNNFNFAWVVLPIRGRQQF